MARPILPYHKIRTGRDKVLDGANDGFTIIELMMATVLFSVVMLILTYGVIRITDIYYRGVAITTTQNTARNIVTDISQTIEFSGGQVGTADLEASHAGDTQVFCIGNRAYYYQLGYEMVSSNPGPGQALDALVVLDNVTACPSNPTGIILVSGNIPSGGQEMLQPNMRLSKFKVIESNKIPNLYNIDVQVTYGSDNSLNNPRNYNGIGGSVTCIGGISTQLCATSELNTSVAMRVE
jgi:prepilin-type N-terminal cleavage/methylation domain-containing protein